MKIKATIITRHLTNGHKYALRALQQITEMIPGSLILASAPIVPYLRRVEETIGKVELAELSRDSVIIVGILETADHIKRLIADHKLYAVPSIITKELANNEVKSIVSIDYIFLTETPADPYLTPIEVIE